MLPSRRGSRAEGGLEGKQQAAGSEQRLARRGARITPSFVPGYKSTGGEDDIKGSIRRRRERCRRHQPRHGPAAASPPAIQTPPFAMTASVWMWRNTRLGSDATNGSQPSSLCGPDKGRTNLGTHRTITNSADKTKNFSRLLYSKSQKKKGKKALFACTQYAVNKWASVFRIERPNLLVDSWAVWTFANKSLSPITISVLRPYFTFRSSFPSVIFHFGPCLRKSLALAVSLPPPPLRRRRHPRRRWRHGDTAAWESPTAGSCGSTSSHPSSADEVSAPNPLVLWPHRSILKVNMCVSLWCKSEWLLMISCRNLNISYHQIGCCKELVWM